ncbi:MAG TPA: recombinase A [Polyangiaceae bacterium]|nr:recombinase A [Polyangiaceae bacterium]
MALPAHLLEHFPARIRPGESGGTDEPKVLPLGIDELDSLLPGGGLPRGGVVELSVAGGVALATSVALAACRAAGEAARAAGGDVPWCAFVDPSQTLHGPGVQGAQVNLERLLVVRPSVEALGRTAIRLVESQAFSVVVVDTVGVPGAALDVALSAWPRVVRRLAMAAGEGGTTVLLITDTEAHRPLPLPVALRLELQRPGADRLSVQIAKERRGRISHPRTINWAKPRAKVLPHRPLAPVAPISPAVSS